MMKNNENNLFNLIAPIYGLFYNRQRKRFSKVIRKGCEKFDLLSYESVLDVGCGTGALCSVLYEKGLQVTGVDPAKKMIDTARRNSKDKDINFMIGDVLERLPFKDNSFDIAISSYVAHGLNKKQRKKMYKEMSRVAKEFVIIYDYNKTRSILTNIIEILERGDYFNFIRYSKREMEKVFSQVEVFDVDVKAAWYICSPRLN